MNDTFRRSGRLLLDDDGDLWRLDEWHDRDYLGRIDDPMTTYDVSPEELPVLAIWAADYLDASADLHGEARAHYLSTRGTR